MNNGIIVEIAGYKEMECSPFPCDQDRTCMLSACAPSGKLLPAVEALREQIRKEFREEVIVKLTLLDEEVPDHIRIIYESEHPAIPMILINGRIIPLGRISWPQIRDAIHSELYAQKNS